MTYALAVTPSRIAVACLLVVVSAAVRAQSGFQLNSLTVPATSLPSGCLLKPTPAPRAAPVAGGAVTVIDASLQFPNNPWSGTDRKLLARIHAAIDGAPRKPLPDVPLPPPRHPIADESHWAGNVVHGYRAAYTAIGAPQIEVFAVTFSDVKFAVAPESLSAMLNPRRGAPQARTDSPLYAPLFVATYHGGPAVGFAVQDTSIAMPTLRGRSPDWLRQFEDVPAALRVAASRAEPTTVGPVDPKSLPAGIKRVPAHATRAIVVRGSSDALEAFKREHDINGWLAVSDPLTDPSGLHALVYYEAECGGLCGEAGYVWLQRDSAQSPWRLKKKIGILLK